MLPCSCFTLSDLVAGELFPERLQDKTASCQMPFLPVVAEPETTSLNWLRDVFIPKPLRQLSLHTAGIKLASGVFVAVHSVPLQPGDGMGGFRRLLALS